MPTMVRLDCSSEAMNRGLVEEKGTTFEGFSIETTLAACFGGPAPRLTDWSRELGWRCHQHSESSFRHRRFPSLMLINTVIAMDLIASASKRTT